MRIELPPKLTSVTRNYEFDFSADLAVGETITAQVVTAAVYSGTDASPSSIVNGSASASGGVVTQSIMAGVLGVIYELTCQATTSASQVLKRIGLLAIVPNA